MPSQRAIQLTSSSETVTKALAQNPTRPIASLTKGLFKNAHATTKQAGKEESELEKAAQCGKFPGRPSELFLKIYNDVLNTLESDPLVNMVSPSLMGASGVIPLSIVSVIPDIMRHYADLIVRAESEVFLATNYWEPSHSSTIISDSFRELSKRVQARGGKKVVVKLMYDRGDLHQLVKNHVPVSPSGWAKVNLPKAEEIPGVSLEVVNYHRPPLGTFHAKYIVVDRRVACVNSNNIQDRPNVEMMVHLEGPIVDSFYDMALLSWANAMNPPLPLLSKQPEYSDAYKFNHDNEHLKYIDQEATSKATREFLKKQHTLNDEELEELASPPRRRRTLGRANSHDNVTSSADRERQKLVAEHPNMMVPHASNAKLGQIEEETKEGDGANGNGNGNGQAEGTGEQPNGEAKTDNAPGAGSAGVPNGTAGDKPLDGAAADASNSNGDAANGDASNGHAGAVTVEPEELGTNPLAVDEHTKSGNAEIAKEMVEENKRAEVTAAEVAKRLNIGKVQLDATVEDAGVADFKPYILHQPHPPCPIAMVNRKPAGRPGHRVNNPQDIAWLGAIKYAQKSFFIQTPTFNASPLIPATLDACRRGIEVTLYLDLGFNDQGEQIPFQGGTNEMVVHGMYSVLNKEGNGHEKNLKVFWYTGKDQKRPISAAAKKRNCHVKFMAVDDQIAIFGNGNQDTQSWFHSMEINVMVDSPALVREWLDGLDANQNTRQFGRVSDVDGIWRDGDEVVQASGIHKATILDWMRSVSGVFRRLRGSGGF